MFNPDSDRLYIQDVTLRDGMHAIAQRDILDIKAVVFGVEAHAAASASRAAAIFSAVASPAEVMMSRLPA